MKYKHLVDFNSQAISFNNYDWIVNFVNKNDISSVLEFGPGSSTWAFNEKDKVNITSYEYNLKWCSFYKKMFEEYKNINIKPLNSFSIEKFDLSFVDSPKGRGRFSRLETCILSTFCSNLIILHDAIRPGEKETSETMKSLGWKYELVENNKKERGFAIYSKRIYTL